MIAECPCGADSTRTYATCCGPLHLGERRAETAEELMRSRYSAFALGLEDYLVTTWHPRTRPQELELPDREWLGLTVLDTVDGGPQDEEGIVEFEARYADGSRSGVQRERSTFARRAGRWLYVDAI